MRIIAGRARGLHLKAPKGLETRPTAARVREAVFSILNARLGGFDGLEVLDAFAGSGANGLEAWSRGAARVTFIDHGRAPLACIAANIEAAKAGAASCLHRKRLPRALADVPTGPYDLVFLDPPYKEHALLEETLAALVAHQRLKPGAVLVVEHTVHFTPQLAEGRVSLDSRRYGETQITLVGFGERGEPDEAAAE